jgi:hypothetical protein
LWRRSRPKLGCGAKERIQPIAPVITRFSVLYSNRKRSEGTDSDYGTVIP